MQSCFDESNGRRDENLADEPSVSDAFCMSEARRYSIERRSGESDNSYRLRLVHEIMESAKFVSSSPLVGISIKEKIRQFLVAVDWESLYENQETIESLAWVYQRINEIAEEEVDPDRDNQEDSEEEVDPDRNNQEAQAAQHSAGSDGTNHVRIVKLIQKTLERTSSTSTIDNNIKKEIAELAKAATDGTSTTQWLERILIRMLELEASQSAATADSSAGAVADEYFRRLRANPEAYQAYVNRANACRIKAPPEVSATIAPVVTPEVVDTIRSNKQDRTLPLAYPALVAAALLFFALVPGLPLGYFLILRWVVCIVSCIYLVMFNDRRGWFWTMTVMAIVFNPVIRFHFNRYTWQVIDLVSGLIFLSSIPFLWRQGRRR
jgi:hypothetical protein